MLRRTLVTTFALLATGCSQSQSTASGGTPGRERIYRLSGDEALAIAQTTILRAFPGRRVEPIEGPIRGFSTYTRMMLDTFTQQILVIPVRGNAPTGEMIDGYSFEVSGSGTSGSGAIRNDSFFDLLQSELDRTGTAVNVTNMRQRLTPARPRIWI